jgi:hypothetical protein
MMGVIFRGLHQLTRNRIEPRRDGQRSTLEAQTKAQIDDLQRLSAVAERRSLPAMQLLSFICINPTLLSPTAEQSGGDDDDDLQGAKGCASQDAILAQRALRNRTLASN